MVQTTYDSTKELLSDLLKDAGISKLQLPDFQRGWVWDDYSIQSLLASISQSFPIGAIMVLQEGGEVRFKPRPIEGVEYGQNSISPERLILDGQQRITSLYQACVLQKPVATINTQRRKVVRWYYIDMKKALNPETDREDAIVGLPEDKKVTKDFGREIFLDLSIPDFEYEASMFPVNQLFDFYSWQNAYSEFWDYDKNKIRFFQQFQETVIEAFRKYQVPLITLKKETTKEAVCLVFEKVNTGGKKLDAFELLTAIFAADNFNLREDWLGDSREGKAGRVTRLSRYNVLQNIQSTDFLQAISLLHTKNERETLKAAGVTNPKELPPVNCTRKTLLNLPLESYKKYADLVEHGFIKAAKFLTLQKIFWFKDVPYQTQLVPLAALLSNIGDRWEEEKIRKKLAKWYWCGVFGELYGSAVETRFAKDFVEVAQWLDGGPEPTTVIDATITTERLITLRTRLSAAYKGINALLKREGAMDFRSGQPIEYTNFWEENIDIHHIFPRKWCEKKEIPKSYYDSVVNKTALPARTNRIIGARAPSDYLLKIQKEVDITEERLEQLLISHLIEPELIKNDSFYEFFENRLAKVLELIEGAMGKSLSKEGSFMKNEEEGEIIEDEEEMIENIEVENPFD